MPIFEYRCTDCGSDYEILHRSRENPDEISCPACASKRHTKKMSSFAATGLGASSAPSCESGNCDFSAASSPCAGGMCGLN